MKREDKKDAREHEARRIRKSVIEHVDKCDRGLARLVSIQTGIQQAHVYIEIRAMVADGLLHAEGKTASRRYRLTPRGMQERERLEARKFRTARGEELLSEADAELLARKPRTIFEAERRAWLMKKFGGRRK